MTETFVLTETVVAFLMRALADGRITRSAACDLVTPWVEGAAPSTPLAEDGAQLIHGFDVVEGDDGIQFHGRDGNAMLSFAVAEPEMIRRCNAWLLRAGLA